MHAAARPHLHTVLALSSVVWFGPACTLACCAQGGVAWADNDHTVDFLGTTILTASNTRTGAMIGAGVEYAFAPNWSAKLEYNFMDFGSHNLGFNFACADTVRVSVCGRNVNVDITENIHLIKFGINYRLNWGAPAVAARY
jgi:outer membrane immunogenic protein